MVQSATGGGGGEGRRRCSRDRGDSVGSHSLESSLIGRLSKLERDRKELIHIIEDQKEKMASLGDEVSSLKDAQDDLTAAKAMKTLKEENARLRAEISDMKTFLDSQGLRWVGYAKKKKDIHADREGNALQKNVGNAASHIDFDALVATLQRLNGHQRANAKRGGFVDVESVPLTLYSNGILVRRGPFRAFRDSKSRASAFVRECMSGVIPSEFQEEFPGGVRFNLVDRRSERFKDGRPQSSSSSRSQRKMTKLQFLRRLPQQIITSSGRVVRLREKFSGADLEKENGDEGGCAGGVVEASAEKIRAERRRLMTEALKKRGTLRDGFECP
eukprot:g4121.t1